MRGLIGNLLLAFAWMGMTGELTIPSFAFGFALGLALLWLVGDLVGAGDYLRRVGAGARLAALFARELVRANLRVAGDVVTPQLRARPAIVGLDLRIRGDFALLLLSTLITLTPGSVVVYISPDRSRMYVYGAFAGDPQAYRRQLADIFEQGVLGLTE